MADTQSAISGNGFYDHDTKLVRQQTKWRNCIFLSDTAPCYKYSTEKQEFAAENASGCFVYKPLTSLSEAPRQMPLSLSRSLSERMAGVT